jgi:type 1 glutamine amidotransferase
VLRSQAGGLLLGNEKGEVTALKQTDVAGMTASRVSVMPEKLLDKLTAEQQRDLMTYLLSSPPRMPLDSPLTAPPLRTQAEVAAALAGSAPLPSDLKPLTIVLVDGAKDHGPGEHDYPAWQQQWLELLSAADNVTVETAHEFPTDEQLSRADALLIFQKGSFDRDRMAQTDAFLKRGGGATYIHWAVNGNDQVGEFARRIGYASWGGRISYRHGPLSLDLHNTSHPILRNYDQLNPLHLYDESYWKLTGDPADVTLLATSTEDGMPTPQLWVTEKGSGRVLVSIPGHYSWTFDDPLFRNLLLRGVAWTVREPVDRFNDLVTIGARMSR